MRNEWLYSSSTLREDPVTPEPAFSTVADWLDSIKMNQYKEHFSSAGYFSLDSVLYVSARLVSQLMLCKVWPAFLKTSNMFNLDALLYMLYCTCMYVANMANCFSAQTQWSISDSNQTFTVGKGGVISGIERVTHYHSNKSHRYSVSQKRFSL